MAPSKLRLSLIDDDSGFRSLREPWTALCSRVAHPCPFLSFDWCWHAWKRVAEPRRYSLRLIVGHDADHLVLVWPLMASHRELHMLSARVFEYRDVVAERSESASSRLDQAWSFVQRSAAADSFVFQNLHPESPLCPILAGSRGATCAGGGWSHVIGLEDYTGWSPYAAALPKSLVRDQGRQWRRIRERLPGISLQVVDQASDVAATVDWIVRQKAAWATARGVATVWCAEADKLAFLKAVMPALLEDRSLVLARLGNAATTVSAGWGYRCGSDFTLHAFAYDPAYETYSPSRLLLEQLVQYSFERGFRTFDLMRGDEQFKRVWATRQVRTESFRGYLNWQGALAMKLAAWRSARAG